VVYDCHEPGARNAIATLSARAYHRVLKAISRGEIARWQCTIANLAGEEKIAPTHLAEALQYRPKLGMM
jgi:magnesium chelatase family protein